jgi:hypothetical protein
MDECAGSGLKPSPGERFSCSRSVTGGAECGFYFHPTDEDLSVGTPLRKKPLSGSCFPL